MAETYPGAPYPGDEPQPTPKKGMSGWLIALIVLIVLVFLCCICAFAALLLLGPATRDIFSTIIETVEATTPMP